MYSYSCMLYGIWTMVLPNREQISNTQLATLIHGYYCTAPCHAIYYNIGYSAETASIIVVIVLVAMHMHCFYVFFKMSLYFAETSLLFNVFYQLLLNKIIIFVIMITRPANYCHLSDIVRHQTFFSTGYATTDWASL